MRIQTNSPFAFSHIGQRTSNQDALYPAVGMANEQTQLFVVCDGMGGADKGEVASQLLCDAVAGYAERMDYPIFDIVHLQTAIDQAYKAYQAYLQQNPLVSRMGSTLSLLQLHQHGATIAHIGDSRVYQLRAGKVIFQTYDHKQVNDMVETGIITATQALTHPWRNRLSRAVVASAGDADQSVRSTPDVAILTDVRAGDYFFMCTDGVLERLDNQKLESLLAAPIPGHAQGKALVALCEGQTKDNYSGYLISVRSVSKTEPVRSAVIS